MKARGRYFTPTLDVMVARPPHRSYYPTEDDVVNDDMRCLVCLPDGSKAPIYDGVEVVNDVCVHIDSPIFCSTLMSRCSGRMSRLHSVPDVD